MKAFSLLLVLLGAIDAVRADTPVPAAEPLLWGTVGSSLGHAATGRRAGWRVALVSVRWSQFQPAPGVIAAGYVQELQYKAEALRQLGYKLQLDFGVQYAPAWVFALKQGRYRNQYGQVFESRESGRDVPNLVFNAEVRQTAAAYFGAVFEQLGTNWDYVRLGCAGYGELNFPPHNFGGRTNCYWAFDELAQGTAPGLPAGLPTCPVPGWMPGVASESHRAARAFADWYLEALANYQDWQIRTVRRWFTGDLCLLYGSWGLRPQWLEAAVATDLSGASPAEINGEVQQGYDWERMVRRLQDPKAIVYCTWLDATLQERDLSNDGSPDPARWSPAHWLSTLAAAHPLRLRVWGENTGHNTRATMERTFARVKQFRLMGMMWAFEPELFAPPSPRNYASFFDYAELIGRQP